jgi:hypothetical protein
MTLIEFTPKFELEMKSVCTLSSAYLSAACIGVNTNLRTVYSYATFEVLTEVSLKIRDLKCFALKNISKSQGPRTQRFSVTTHKFSDVR